uniref:Pre-mRNA-splicing factor cwc25-like n=1 Tax=Elaeis guineensis var. tenera TaxID=51953 RepID=A0A6I9QVA0_ELAGV|nr:pre-mRNA-splicing factor cwc25-like [Elaeis guineensis]
MSYENTEPPFDTPAFGQRERKPRGKNPSHRIKLLYSAASLGFVISMFPTHWSSPEPSMAQKSRDDRERDRDSSKDHHHRDCDGDRDHKHWRRHGEEKHHGSRDERHGDEDRHHRSLDDSPGDLEPRRDEWHYDDDRHHHHSQEDSPSDLEWRCERSTRRTRDSVEWDRVSHEQSVERCHHSSSMRKRKERRGDEEELNKNDKRVMVSDEGREEKKERWHVEDRAAEDSSNLNDVYKEERVSKNSKKEDGLRVMEEHREKNMVEEEVASDAEIKKKRKEGKRLSLKNK